MDLVKSGEIDGFIKEFSGPNLLVNTVDRPNFVKVLCA